MVSKWCRILSIHSMARHAKMGRTNAAGWANGDLKVFFLWRGIYAGNTGMAIFCLPGVSMTLKKWGITLSNGVVDLFLKGHGDSR